ncbi:MAG: hypothetical protein AAGA99_11300 [Actinomycetota bacterium]
MPDELAAQILAVDLDVSRICEEALRVALTSQRVEHWLHSLANLPPLAVSADAVEDAVAAAKDNLEGR